MIVSRETRLKLERYVEILLKWNKKINLIAKSTEETIWTRHIEDCARLLQCLDLTKKIVDLGSGAGLPGIVLSICGAEDITLIEADKKKCAFLKYVSGVLELKVKIVEERIEKLSIFGYDFVVARAFSSLMHILDLSKHLLHPGGEIVLLKGDSVLEEVREAMVIHSFHYKLIESTNITFGPIICVRLNDKNHCDSKSKRWGWEDNNND